MNKTYLSRKIFARLSLRAAARMICCILTLALWGPARAGAQEQTQPLDVASINDKLTLTYKLKPNSSPDYAWFYKVGTSGSDTEFSGTLTGTNENWQHGSINIKSEKAIANADKDNPDSYSVLKLDGLNLTSTADGSLFYMVENGKPLCIQATGQSASTLKSGGTVIKDHNGCNLFLDGGAKGLNIHGIRGGKDESKGIDLFTNSNIVNVTFKGKINIVANKAVVLDNSSGAFSTDAAEVKFSSWTDATCVSISKIISPFLEWRFASAPENGKTLEIKDANGNSLDPAIQFTTNGENKSFAINVAKNTGYTLWLDGKQLMDKDEKTVFTATDDKLVPFSGMALPTDWNNYGKTAHVGTDGNDIAVSVSGTNYTVKTPRGLAWIAWVTNNGKSSADTQEAYAAYYPPNKGFEGCTVTLAGNISLATLPDVADSFNKSWYPIGKSQNEFKGIFDGGGHTVSGLSITSFNETLYFGLFGYIVNAVVKNLRVAGGITTGQAITKGDPFYFGGIAGYAGKSKIIACSNAVGIDVNTNSGWHLYIGGVAGVQDEGVINNCWNEAPLSGEITGYMYNIGGIVGKSESGSISNCYSLGNVSGSGTNTSDLPCAIGGIIGWLYDSVSLSNCYATGSVSAINTATGKSVWAGGIAGCYSYSNYADGTILQSTISNCLALNAGSESMISVTATGGTAHIGRILGESSPHCIISDCYASSKIKLKEGDKGAVAPTKDIAHDKINGQSLFLDDVAADIAAWAGPEDTKAFTAIGTDADGLLPRLKQIASFGNDHLPTQYRNEAIPGQPTASMKSTDYLVDPDPLFLSSGDTITITLSCSNDKWSYKKGEGIRLTRFNGTVKMDSSEGASCNKLVISTLTGNPTLTFEKVAISPNDGIALTIDEGCALTINTTGEGASALRSSAASTVVNKGSLTLTGRGLDIENTSSDDTRYGLDNSGSFTVASDPATSSMPSVAFHCANTAIHNAGTLGNAWMEWRFATEAGPNGAGISFKVADTPPTSTTRKGKTFAMTVEEGKAYDLFSWSPGFSNAQKGTDSDGTLVSPFPAPAEKNAVAVFTDVKDLKKITISDAQTFSGAGCAYEKVTVKSGGVLTVDTENAAVFSLLLEEGAQVVTTKALKVLHGELSFSRNLDNRWTAFSSPYALNVSVSILTNDLLYVATGYTGTDAAAQAWDNIPGTSTAGMRSVDLAAASPYLLANEKFGFPVWFTAPAPIEIPATATATLGDALADGVFLFQANPNLANLTLSDIYVLNAEGTRFELQEGEHTLKPYEAYITANAVTRSRLRSVGVADGSTVTANEIAAATAALRVWAADGALHVCTGEAAALTVVRSDGRVVYAASIAPGDTRLALPSGIYMVRINNITYKIAL